MTKDHFEKMAKRYDSEEQIELAKVITNEVKTVLQHSTSKSLLDYGGGTGLISLELADIVDSVLVVDASKQMIEIAEGKIEHRQITNAKVLQADFIEETPTVKADIILMSLVLLHIPDTQKILREIFHTLNEDGQLIIVDFDKNKHVSHPDIHNGFSHDDLKSTLADVGFQSTEIRSFYKGKRIFAKQDASMFISISKK